MLSDSHMRMKALRDQLALGHQLVIRLDHMSGLYVAWLYRTGAAMSDDPIAQDHGNSPLTALLNLNKRLTPRGKEDSDAG